MKKLSFILPVGITVMMSLLSCSGGESTAAAEENTENTSYGSQAGVDDEDSEMNIVKVAIGSKDHSTLVTAVQAAELVDVLASSGPYTVFAPTNAAFDALPKGTVEGLLKPEKKKDLANILEYHVSVPVYKEEMLSDGQVMGMANGGKATISVKDGKMMINDANIVGSVMASNGIVYIIDKVLLPPAK